MCSFRRISLVALIILCIASRTSAQKNNFSGRQHWVDSVYSALNEEERIGQLFMVAAYSGGKNYNEDAVTKLIAAHQVGGLIFMQGGAGRQAILTNRYQHAAQTPLLVAMDGEWGPGHEAGQCKEFPEADDAGRNKGHCADV